MARIIDSRIRVRIRQFSAEDQEAVRQLVLEGLGEHFGVIDETLNPDLDDIANHYSAQGHAFFLAIYDGQIVGTGALLLEEPGVGRIARVAVGAEYRRRGIGQQIVRFLLQEAHSHRCHRVLVETNHDWYGAINLYKGEGFEEEFRDVESIHMVCRRD